MAHLSIKVSEVEHHAWDGVEKTHPDRYGDPGAHPGHRRRLYRPGTAGVQLAHLPPLLAGGPSRCQGRGT